MCQSTQYPTTYLLHTIIAKAVVKALSKIIKYQVTDFSSNLVAQVLKQVSSYHAQSQGAFEQFHQTLKSLFLEYCVELDQDSEGWMLAAKGYARKCLV